ncbi:recombinase family protein [Abditibacterium utsteinense]|uniref:recombinase family protein n=1 Tax=Abditibacterium utsteinense TaxID=1960156 RepID=UPI001EE74228|nr:recombinase family protein [Abditibacterium utsteinense]
MSYCRVSSETQREKETVRTQIELNEKFCAANGYTLVETYIDDGVSGTTHLHERPAGARLLQDARAGKFDAVVVYKADRLGRSPLVNETLALEISGKLGIAIVGVAEQIDLSSPIGAAMFTFQSAIGRLERENTLQRSRDATLRLAREGAWLGGIVPFGYRVEGKERAARLVVADAVNPATNLSEADVVRLIYKLAGEEGKSSIQIAERLNVLGVPTSYARDGREVVRNKRKERTQEVWRPGRIRNMLVEPTYKGVHVWGKRSKTKLGAGGEVKGPPSSAPCPQLSTQSSGTRRN